MTKTRSVHPALPTTAICLSQRPLKDPLPLSTVSYFNLDHRQSGPRPPVPFSPGIRQRKSDSSMPRVQCRDEFSSSESPAAQ